MAKDAEGRERGATWRKGKREIWDAEVGIDRRRSQDPRTPRRSTFLRRMAAFPNGTESRSRGSGPLANTINVRS